MYQRERQSLHLIIMAEIIIQIISLEFLINNNLISQNVFWSVIVLQLQ